MMIRVSNLLGESILLFISLSILSLVSLSYFIPSLNIGYSTTLSNYEDGYSYGYSFSYLFSDSLHVYLYNYGRDVSCIKEIYVNGFAVATVIEVFNGSGWVKTCSISSGSIFRLEFISYGNFSELDFVVDDGFIVHVEVI